MARSNFILVVLTHFLLLVIAQELENIPQAACWNDAVMAELAKKEEI